MADGSEQPLDIYSDSFQFAVGPYGISLTLGTSPANSTPGHIVQPKEHVVVRMSLEHAKVVAMVLRRTLKRYEMENGLEIALPPGLYTQLGIAREDWADGSSK